MEKEDALSQVLASIQETGPRVSVTAKFIPITKQDFEDFKRLQVTNRWDWPAVFSVNCHGEIWPFVTYGITSEIDREDVRGLSRTLDRIADEYLRIRPEGGRFFLNESGAFFKDERKNQFVVFKLASATRDDAAGPGGRKEAGAQPEEQARVRRYVFTGPDGKWRVSGFRDHRTMPACGPYGIWARVRRLLSSYRPPLSKCFYCRHIRLWFHYYKVAGRAGRTIHGHLMCKRCVTLYHASILA